MRSSLMAAESRPGFTLIEVLIVLTIMGLLTSSFVLNTARVKETQQEVLLRNSVLALLEQARMKVRSGVVENPGPEATRQCFGLGLQTGALPVELVGAWDGSTCSATDEKPLSLALGSVAVQGLKSGGEHSAVTVWYLPPEGTLQILDEGVQPLSDGLHVSFSEQGARVFLSPATGLPVLRYPTQDEAS